MLSSIRQTIFTRTEWNPVQIYGKAGQWDFATQAVPGRLYPAARKLTPPPSRPDGQKSFADREYELMLSATGGDDMSGKMSTANVYPFGPSGHPLWPELPDIFVFTYYYRGITSQAGWDPWRVYNYDPAFDQRVRDGLGMVRAWVARGKDPRMFFSAVHDAEVKRDATDRQRTMITVAGIASVATIAAGGIIAGATAAGAAGATGAAGEAGIAGVAGEAGATAFTGATVTASVSTPVAALPAAGIGLTEVAEGAVAVGASGLSIWQGVKTKDPDKILSGVKTVASIDPSGLDLSGFLEGESTTEGGRRLVSSLFGQLFPDQERTTVPAAPAQTAQQSTSRWKWVAIGAGALAAITGVVLLARVA